MTIKTIAASKDSGKTPIAEPTPTKTKPTSHRGIILIPIAKRFDIYS